MRMHSVSLFRDYPAATATDAVGVASLIYSQDSGTSFPIGTTTGTAILPRIARSEAQTLNFSFTRHTDRIELILTVQAADSVDGPWMELARSTAGAPFVALTPETTVLEDGIGNTRNVTVTDGITVTDPVHPRRFMRLLVDSVEAN